MDTLAFLDTEEAFFDDLRYEFRYDESEKALKVSYSFLTGMPYKEVSVTHVQTYSHTIRYLPPRHKGRNPRLDAIFDDPQVARSLAKRAESIFAKDLGSAIEKALQLLIHRAMYQCGVLRWTESAKLMTDRLAEFYRADTAKALGIKMGRNSRFKDADHYHRMLFECIQEALENGEMTHSKQFTQEAAAERITKKLKAEVHLDVRIIRQWNKDYGVNWRKFVNETWEWLIKKIGDENEG